MTEKLVREYELLKSYLLEQPWHKQCEFIERYMPPFPRADTQPKFVVRYNDGTKYAPFLRHSKGPRQGFGWDIYGDDLLNMPLAIIALSQAPAPPKCGVVIAADHDAELNKLRSAIRELHEIAGDYEEEWPKVAKRVRAILSAGIEP